MPLPESVFAIVMGGAALMDLALHNRIDTDLERLTVVDRTPLGDDILDDVLKGLGKGKSRTELIDRRCALRRRRSTPRSYRGARRCGELIARGILKAENGRHLWVFRTRRYPVIDDTEQQEVRTRLRQLILSNDIPDPRDVVLVCLIDACALARLVCSAPPRALR